MSYMIYDQATTWLLVATGLLSVISALLGYTAIALESRCLLASVFIILYTMLYYDHDGDGDADDDLGYTAIALESRCLLASVTLPNYDILYKMDNDDDGGDDIGYTAIALERYFDDNLGPQYTILLVLVFMFESVIGLLAYVYQVL